MRIPTIRLAADLPNAIGKPTNPPLTIALHLGSSTVERVWYAAYGSNLLAARFGAYVTGGRVAGSDRVHHGMRDPTPPTQVRAVTVPGQVYFALESPTWGGGLALYDPDAPGETPARAYLLTVGQFSDLAAQEMHREPVSDLDLADALVSGRHQVGPGRYETIVRTGDLDGSPVLTVTAPWHLDDVSPTAPAAAYLRMLAAGLAEAHGWTPGRIAAHLAGLPGAAGAWTPAQVLDLIT